MKTNGWTGIYAVDRDCVCIGTDAGISPATEIEIQLMCEAGTVANETGLSPGELLEQRDKAIELLKRYLLPLMSQNVQEGYTCWEQTLKELIEFISNCKTKERGQFSRGLLTQRGNLWSALYNISQMTYLDCGCVPCTGKCNDREALMSLLDEIRDQCNLALKSFKTNGGSDA
jgi:hypothetical protein